VGGSGVRPAASGQAIRARGAVKAAGACGPLERLREREGKIPAMPTAIKGERECRSSFRLADRRIEGTLHGDAARGARPAGRPPPPVARPGPVALFRPAPCRPGSRRPVSVRGGRRCLGSVRHGKTGGEQRGEARGAAPGTVRLDPIRPPPPPPPPPPRRAPCATRSVPSIEARSGAAPPPSRPVPHRHRMWRLDEPLSRPPRGSSSPPASSRRSDAPVDVRSGTHQPASRESREGGLFLRISCSRLAPRPGARRCSARCLPSPVPSRHRATGGSPFAARSRSMIAWVSAAARSRATRGERRPPRAASSASATCAWRSAW